MFEFPEAFDGSPIDLLSPKYFIYPLSTSNSSCLGAVGLGASLVERHFTDSKHRIGPDISCSMTPVELQDLIKMTNEIYAAKGGGKGLSKKRVKLSLLHSHL